MDFDAKNISLFANAEGLRDITMPAMPSEQLQAMDHLGLNLGLGNGLNTMEGKPPPVEKKRKHKLTEQKGRQKINSQITDLKNLLPECKYVITTKASILECAVKSLQRLQGLCNQLMQSNKSMQKENKRLKMELIKISGGQITFPFDETDEIEDQGKQYLQDSPQNNMVPDLSNLDSLLGSDEMENFGEYSSPNSSPPFLSPPAYTPPMSPHTNNNSPTHQNIGMQEDETAKVSRRRLMLVFLFMIPFFLSMDSFDHLLSDSKIAGVPRAIKEEMSADAMDNYLEIAKFFWYMILGTLGMVWIANTLLWMNGLGKHTTFIAKKARKVIQCLAEPESS